MTFGECSRLSTAYTSKSSGREDCEPRTTATSREAQTSRRDNRDRPNRRVDRHPGNENEHADHNLLLRQVAIPDPVLARNLRYDELFFDQVLAIVVPLMS